MLKETDPETFWQTPHYEGWPAVLVRYDSADPDRVRAMIERSRDWTAAKAQGEAAEEEVTPHFERFVAIDWSGAKGKRHKGIAIAIMRSRGSGAPALVRPDHIWSRTEVLDWLLEAAEEAPTLFGFDFSFAPPIAERGEYLPGDPDVPDSAREFWAYVDRRCDDEDLGAASFLERTHRRHFYFGSADGTKADFMHFRRCDARLNALGGRKTASAFDAIGAAQVAKASFAGCAFFTGWTGKIAIWPMDPLARPGQRDRRNLHAHLPAPRRPIGRQAQVASRAGARAWPHSAARPPDWASSRTITRPTRS